MKNLVLLFNVYLWNGLEAAGSAQDARAVVAKD